ncbi:MAG TPA: PIN domain-containing protein [Nocardioidaceae bacterium]|nr:PIN domain-containing protein [Nocardioidaceae bacterium]
MTFLLDTPAWVLGGRNRAVAERRAMAMRSGDLGVSTVTAWDVLYSSRDVEEYKATLDRLRRLPWISDPRAAVAVQHRLAQRGQHRTSLPDVIVATTAAEHGLTVLHHDSDHERLAEVTGAAHEWVAPRGEGHGRTS